MSQTDKPRGTERPESVAAEGKPAERAHAAETNAENSNDRPKRDRSYMRTWGSSLENKMAFAEEHESEEKPEVVDLENVVVSPNLDADGKPVTE